MRRLLKGLLIPALTIVILSAAAELGLRVAFARSLDFNMEMWKYAVALKQRNPMLNQIRGIFNSTPSHLSR